MCINLFPLIPVILGHQTFGTVSRDRSVMRIFSTVVIVGKGTDSYFQIRDGFSETLLAFYFYPFLHNRIFLPQNGTGFFCQAQQKLQYSQAELSYIIAVDHQPNPTQVSIKTSKFGKLKAYLEGTNNFTKLILTTTFPPPWVNPIPPSPLPVNLNSFP